MSVHFKIGYIWNHDTKLVLHCLQICVNFKETKYVHIINYSLLLEKMVKIIQIYVWKINDI